MNQYFARNAAVVRSSYPLSFKWDDSLKSLRANSLETAEYLAALVLLLVASPILLLCMALIRLTSRGPAIFAQERVGKNGESFLVYKLRTMRVDAEAATGPVLSWKGDPRVTVLGSILRKTHLDEVPQLWNVMRGEMALVGPRPERPVFVRQFREAIPHYEVREKVKPGITGLAQVCCGYEARAEEKLEFDLLYIQHRNSINLYALILFYTVKKVLLARIAG